MRGDKWAPDLGHTRAGVKSTDLWPLMVRAALTLDLAKGIGYSHPLASCIPEFTASKPLNVTRVYLRRPCCLTRTFIP